MALETDVAVDESDDEADPDGTPARGDLDVDAFENDILHSPHHLSVPRSSLLTLYCSPLLLPTVLEP